MSFNEIDTGEAQPNIYPYRNIFYATLGYLLQGNIEIKEKLGGFSIYITKLYSLCNLMERWFANLEQNKPEWSGISLYDRDQALKIIDQFYHLYTFDQFVTEFDKICSDIKFHPSQIAHQAMAVVIYNFIFKEFKSTTGYNVKQTTQNLAVFQYLLKKLHIDKLDRIYWRLPTNTFCNVPWYEETL